MPLISTGALSARAFGFGSKGLIAAPFSAYNFAVPGVDASGNGPVSAPGTVRPLVGGSVAVSYALTLRRYWADSNEVSQTYQSPRDAVFVSPTTNWTHADFVALGLTLNDVRTTTRNINVGIITDVDHDGYWGYYIVTKSESETIELSKWADGSYVQWTTTVQGDSGRQRSVNMGTHLLPAPDDDELLVLAYYDGRGQNNIRFTLT